MAYHRRSVHTLTDLSKLPDSSVRPSRDTATDCTQLVWPVSVCSQSPLRTFQIRTVLSTLPDATRSSPSGNTSTLLTAAVCSEKVVMR